MKILRSGGAVALATLAVAACDNGTEPEDLGDLDLAVATVAAEATLDDVQSMALNNWGVAFGEVAAVPGWGPHGGMAPNDHLERNRTVTFYDEDGNEMDRFDRLLTASVHIVVDVEGSLERPMWSGELERHRDLTVSGLGGVETERTWNGTGSDKHSKVRITDEGDMERHFESETTIEDVMVGVPRSENPWPLSGTITRHVQVTVVNGPNGDVTRERTVVVTFNGTQTVTMTVNGEEFEVDLADRQGMRPHRRGRP